MRGKSLMLQGTATSVGKSLLCCAFLRIMREDGYRVAPFKAQNMALNSFATREGLEMGRAQVTQAQAAGIEPSACMNPVLLKPMGDQRSQVIVEGKPIGNYSALEYEQLKPNLRSMIRQTYEKLENSVDAVVIEGAGSPAEINLKAGDIVNMAMAEMADAPVILVGDINPGGVFASLYGTVMLLPENERRRIKGILINKFRGDLRILRPGLRMLEELLHIPVLGVIPWMNVSLEEEDSQSEKLERKRHEAPIQTAIVRLPHISNYTDFEPILDQNYASVFYTTDPHELQEADLIILPGSKDTVSDLLWLREMGLEREILRHANHGKLIFGICGGFQMLGERILDVQHVESENESTCGLSLLSMETVFNGKKIVRQTKGWFSGEGWLKSLRGTEAVGYEIHHGVMQFGDACSPFLVSENDGLPLGVANKAGNVLGTYLHGVFDDGALWRTMLAHISTQKGLHFDQEVHTQTMNAMREQAFDRLAQTVRQSIDMRDIYTILKGGSVDCGRWDDD